MNPYKRKTLHLGLTLLAIGLSLGILCTMAQHEARVAVVLPFKAGNETAHRSLDFYRGFLLAADHAKISGVSARITAYDEGKVSTPMAQVLDAAAPHADALVGFAYAGHDTEAANFARNHEIPVYLPFCTRIPAQIAHNTFAALPFPDDEAWAEETATLLMATLGRTQVIVMQSEATPIAYRTQQLVNKLKRKNAKIKALPIGATPYDIADVLSKKAANIVITAAVDNDILQNLVKKVRSVSQAHEGKRLTMLVQPEWYEHRGRQTEPWSGLEVFVPTIHFSTPHSNGTKTMVESYRHWFHAEPDGASFTDFLTGYDMGTNILNGLARHGRNILRKEEKTKGHYMDITMKQSQPTACYTNHALRLIHIKGNGTVALISY